ncbi:MurR/RpiR family transcriptional regulator [Paenibacillus chungangensis]|uniref:MurR/RpiR family transcriptional regulator n=1 Tax=Paenibacillus chungangensis TaxID=696535 RepID=A0ABW3HKH5_9BACL
MQGMGKTMLNIRSHMNGLTKTEQKVAQYILDHADETIYYSVTELAEKVGVGETSVLRFCRKLKYSGFQDFKLSLAQDLVMPTEQLHKEVAEEDAPGALSQKIIATHMQILEQTRELIHEEQLSKAIDTLVEASGIYFFGVGTSGLIATQAAHSFMRIGKSSSAHTDSHFQAMQASLIGKGDVAVGISITGSTKDTIENLERAKHTGAKIIAITSNARSPITKVADIILIMAAWENPLQGSSLAAKISQLAVIDILNVAVALKTKDEALKYREMTAKATSSKLY